MRTGFNFKETLIREPIKAVKSVQTAINPASQRVVQLTFHKCGSQWVRDVRTAPAIQKLNGITLDGGSPNLTCEPWPEQQNGTFLGPVYNASPADWATNRRTTDRAIVALRDQRAKDDVVNGPTINTEVAELRAQAVRKREDGVILQKAALELQKTMNPSQNAIMASHRQELEQYKARHRFLQKRMHRPRKLMVKHKNKRIIGWMLWFTKTRRRLLGSSGILA